jgi:diacylglycerol kinase family enzyme
MSRPPAWRALEAAFREVFEASSLFPGEELAVTVVVNPFAGRFSTERRAKRTIETICAVAREATAARRGEASLANGERIRISFYYTHYVGHAHALVSERLGEVRSARHLVISAGGDGTHSEVMSAYIEWAEGAPTTERERTVVSRFPLGTGNDGAETRDLREAILALTGKAGVHLAGYMNVAANGIHLLRGFNIASIGLDAYIAAVTNRIKRMFRGDLYKVVADVATLFYEKIVGVEEMELHLERADGSTSTLAGQFMLMATGVSGHREYGGGKKVLPGAQNLCAIERIGLIGKIKLKALFYRGEHVAQPNVTMEECAKVEVRYARRVPMQIDGESLWLRPENFPVTVTIFEPAIPVLYPIS